MSRIETLNKGGNDCHYCFKWIPKNASGGVLKCSHCGKFQPCEIVSTFLGFEIGRELIAEWEYSYY